MKVIDFTIDQEDLNILYLHTRFAYGKVTLEQWTEQVKKAYVEYFERNTANVEKYGEPKTFFQWVNGQIISLTS